MITIAIYQQHNRRHSMTENDTNTFVLHRWSDREGKKLCAMTAISKKLGYSPLTDTPKEVDPGLAALVSLLSDRANDKARQLLVSRLDNIPNTGRTDICSLIADVFFPQFLEFEGFEEEANSIAGCTSRREKSKAYTALGKRFLKPDGSGIHASGCLMLVAALKTCDPVEQDILAVSAASQVVAFETGEGWFDLLYILDYILGLDDSPYAGSIQSIQDFYQYFGENEPDAEEVGVSDQESKKQNDPFTNTYDFGIRVRWFPALVEKFPERLEDIAKQILDEVAALDSVEIYMRRFAFEDEEVIIATSWDDDLDLLTADADLVAYENVVGEIDLEGDGEQETMLMPVPASEAGYLH
mgnify:CR=1 FL=1